MRHSVFAIAFIAPTFAWGDVDIRFIEGAPTDRFVISNSATCATGPFELSFNLAGSAGNLIFDTTAAGAGVEVFQPVKLASGGSAVSAVTSVTDGDQTLTLGITDLTPGASITITADLDDQLSNSDLGQIRVSGAEISGADVTVLAAATETAGTFDAAARATVPLTGCSS